MAKFPVQVLTLSWIHSPAEGTEMIAFTALPLQCWRRRWHHTCLAEPLKSSPWPLSSSCTSAPQGWLVSYNLSKHTSSGPLCFTSMSPFSSTLTRGPSLWSHLPSLRQLAGEVFCFVPTLISSSLQNLLTVIPDIFRIHLPRKGWAGGFYTTYFIFLKCLQWLIFFWKSLVLESNESFLSQRLKIYFTGFDLSLLDQQQ